METYLACFKTTKGVFMEYLYEESSYGCFICTKKPKKKYELFINLIVNIFIEKKYKIIGVNTDNNVNTPNGCYVKKII